MEEKVIKLRNLSKTYITKKKKQGFCNNLKSLFISDYYYVNAVSNLCFDVEKGESISIIGPNDAGKSTTIKLLIGILYPTKGEAKVLGLVPWKDRIKLAHKIGVVFGQRSQL